MFSALVTRFIADLREVKEGSKWQEALRETIYADPAAIATPIVVDFGSLNNLRANSPKKLTWQIIDHCSAFLRIYALFEKAVCDLVIEYSSLVSRVTPNYQLLDDRIRQQHRIGVGQILTKWSNSNSLYSNIAEKDISSGLSDGLRGQPYSLLPDAFLTSPENFRAGALIRLFTDLGFDNAFAWVRKDPAIVSFLKQELNDSETVDSYLDGFVLTRNEAAHGTVNDVANAKKISNYTDFLSLIVSSFADLLRSSLIRKGVKSNCSVKLGAVPHVWSNNVVGVRSDINGEIKIGDVLYIGKKRIDPVVVQTLRVGHSEFQTLSLSQGFEFGMRLDIRVPQGSDVFRWII